MAYNDLIAKAREYFPNLQSKFKDQSLFMQILGKILFFNPAFMNSFITTIGNTIYWPSQSFVDNNPENVSDIFIHECTHMYDEKRMGTFWFKMGYLFPQILALPILLLLFVCSWKIVIPLMLLCLAPWPAPFRAYFERRAYFVSMRVEHQLYNTDISASASFYAGNFKSSAYYWMMPFGEDNKFITEVENIKLGKPASSLEPELNKMIIDLMSVAK